MRGSKASESMEHEKALALVALVWLIVSFLAMALSIRRGRELAYVLAARHPETYEALGRPRPGFFESARRTRFARFVGRREFEKLADQTLTAQFDAYRMSEARIVVSAVLSGGVLALLVLVMRYLGG